MSRILGGSVLQSLGDSSSRMTLRYACRSAGGRCWVTRRAATKLVVEIFGRDEERGAPGLALKRTRTNLGRRSGVFLTALRSRSSVRGAEGLHILPTASGLHARQPCIGRRGMPQVAHFSAWFRASRRGPWPVRPSKRRRCKCRNCAKSLSLSPSQSEQTSTLPASWEALRPPD